VAVINGSFKGREEDTEQSQERTPSLSLFFSGNETAPVGIPKKLSI